LALLHAPEESFVLQYGLEVSAVGLDGHSASAFLTFSGLPEGYTVTSCYGFSSPLAIRNLSWGSVKSLFR